MKIQKVLKFVGSTRGLRLSKKTLQLWSNVLDCALDDVHSTTSAINPGTKPGVAVLKLVFPKACAAAQAGLINLNNLHAELYPIAPVEDVIYIAEVVEANSDDTLDCVVDSLRPSVRFTLSDNPQDPTVIGECIEVVFRKGEFKRKKKKGLSLK